MATAIRRVTEAEQKQLTEVFLDRVAEFFDEDSEIYPHSLIDDPRKDGEGEITMQRMLELIRLGK